MKIEHASVPHVITVDLVDSLIAQVETSPMPRIRDAAERQLYSVGITLNDISKAIQRDLKAGDEILNQKTHQEQNDAPETQMWLQWLAMYQLAETQLRKVEAALAPNERAA